MEGRTCTKCKLWKEWDQFSHNSDHWLEHNSRCKPCHAEDVKVSCKRVKRRKAFAVIRRAEEIVYRFEIMIGGSVILVLLGCFYYLFIH